VYAHHFFFRIICTLAFTKENVFSFVQVKDIRAIKQNKGFSGIPITDTGKIGGSLLGIVCTRDIDFVGDDDLSVTDVMTKDVIVAKEGCTLSQANELMKNSKKGKLPIVNDKGHLVALISRTDLLKVRHAPNACL
jgi:IMP dehydrogenase